MSNCLPAFLATDPDAYEHFMGRWSARLAEPFLDFAGVSSGGRVLDVGCGTGTISLASAKRGAKTTGLDLSEPYLEGARRLRSHTNVAYEHGDACHLQYSDNSFDACVSALAIDVIVDINMVAAEMRRVTRSGGVVACCTFDFWGGNSVLDLVLDTGAVLDESIQTLRSQIKSRPIVRAGGQANLWHEVGLIQVLEAPIVLSFDYTNFDDYWSSFSTGPTRIAQRLTALPSSMRPKLSSTFEPVTWLTYPTEPDHSRQSSEPRAGQFPKLQDKISTEDPVTHPDKERSHGATAAALPAANQSSFAVDDKRAVATQDREPCPLADRQVTSLTPHMID